MPFVVDRLAADSFPVQAELGGRRYWLENRWGDFPQLNARSELERPGARPVPPAGAAQRGVRAAVPAAPLKDQVFYLSYNGKQFSDSPRARCTRS